MKKLALVTALSLATLTNIKAQEETQNKKNKIIDETFLLAESTSTNPIGVLNDNSEAVGYLASVRKKIGKNGTLMLNNYYSDALGVGNNPNIKFSQKFAGSNKESNINGTIAAQYFFENNNRKSMAVLSSSLNLGKNFSAEMNHWRLPNGDIQNSMGLSAQKEFGNPEKGTDFNAKARVLHVLNTGIIDAKTIAQLKAMKNIENGWGVNATLQSDFMGNNVAGFGVTKSF